MLLIWSSCRWIINNKSSKLLWTLVILFLTLFVECKSDSRCFLQNGGSSISYFVSEAAPIGYNIGSLEIQGDVNRGDIVLSLRESSAPVRIEPGTKNITLTKKLDKEGKDGPSAVTFTVLCDAKQNSNDPSLAYTVHLRVVDENDSTPEWLQSPTELNISEQTLPGTTIMSGLKAVDRDQPGPHSTLTFTALDSDRKPSSLVTFGGGGREGRLILQRPLDYESMPNFDLILRVSDQGIPPLYSDMKLRVNVQDADDQNPRFEHVSYSALLPPHPKAGMLLVIEPGPIHAFDQDAGINAPLRFSLPEGRPESKYFHLDESNGRITLTRDIPEDQLNQPVTLVLKAEQLNNPDRYAISTLNVGKKGHHNAPLHFAQPEFQISVPENLAEGTIIFTALTSRPADRNIKFGLQGDSQGLFQVGPMGQLILKKPLDYETHQKHILKIWATDGLHNVSSILHIHVLNVNEWAPRFRASIYEFNTTIDQMLDGLPVGQIEVADGDLGDSLSLEIQSTDPDLIQIDNNGRLFIHNKTLVKREMMFLVIAKDTGTPPREAFVPVVVRLNDIPTESELLGDVDTLKVVMISSIVLVFCSLAVGIVLYFGYCRKRRKIQTENFHKRVLERNMNNPLALQRLVQPSSLRRSNKIRNMTITSPVLMNGHGHGYHHQNGIDNYHAQLQQQAQMRNGLTPVETTNYISSSNNGGMGTIGRTKSVTWSPKVVQKSAIRNGGPNKIVNSISNNSLDPDTSCTPVEALNSSHNNSNNNAKNTDTMQSTTSLTVYF